MNTWAKFAAFWASFLVWWKAKWGRITAGAGFILSSVEGFDITAIKDPLQNLLTAKGVSYLTVGLFAVSFYRHQQIANRVKKLEAQGGTLPK